jgi:DnaJ-class molecular chaperone
MQFMQGGDMDDMMSAFFGGGGMPGMGGRGAPRRRKGRDVGLALPVTLEDLYNGRSRELPRDKTILCPDCKGRGSNKVGAGGKCTVCKGAGARIVVRQMGPMIQQMQVPCDACGGEGSKIDPKDRCRGCGGNKTKNIQSSLTVLVEKGMEHQQQIPFRGEGDQHPDIDVPGDIVIVLQQIKHEKFVRDESDLHIQQTITLAEALCGFQFLVTHLDGRQLLVRSDPGQIIKPGEKKCVPNEGMPVHKQPNKFGDLIIQFTVLFPERMEESQIERLRTVLPPPKNLDVEYDANDAHDCYVSKTNLDDLRKEIEKEDDDDDEGSGGRGPQMQCAHQ